MRGLLLVLILLLGLVACGPAAASAPAPLTAEAVAASLGTSGLPVVDVRVLTAESDDNHLLGRPGQYTGKILWRDSRTEPGIRNDATIELFPDQASLERRKAYLEPFVVLPITAQYMEVNAGRRLLMRLPHDLTPDQVVAYRDWFARL